MALSPIADFRNVDAAQDPADLLHYLQGLSEVRFMRERCEARLERSRIIPGQTVADLGCGLGGDTIMLGRHVARGGGRAIGIDRSRAMLDFAKARPEASGLPLEFQEGDVHHLSFSDASLDACWLERVLVHMHDPQAVLTEVWRVLRPEGRVVAQEYDYRGFLYEYNDPELSEAIRARFASQFAQPGIGTNLLRYATAAGFSDVELDAGLMPFPNFEWAAAAFRWREYLAELVDTGMATEARAQAWWSGMGATFEEGRTAGYIPSFTLFATR
jgi:SAM-dependent methyltransferase